MVGVHLGSMERDLEGIARRLDRYPNFAVDTAARMEYLMMAPTEKVREFLIKYQDRILYGTDTGFQPVMYRSSFRALESADDHYYESILPSLHWPMYGLALNDQTLRKIYRENALKILKK